MQDPWSGGVGFIARKFSRTPPARAGGDEKDGNWGDGERQRERRDLPDLVGVALTDGLGSEEESALGNHQYKVGSRWTGR